MIIIKKNKIDISGYLNFSPDKQVSYYKICSKLQQEKDTRVL